MKRTFSSSIRGRVAVFGLLVAGVALATSADSAAIASRVLVLSSGDLPQYTEPVRAFLAGYTGETLVVEVGDSKKEGRERIAAATTEGDFAAVFAVGAQAAWLARAALPGTPLAFAMVLDWQRYGLGAEDSGVRVDMPPDALLTRFKLLLPKMKRLGIIVHEGMPAATIEDARKAAADLEIEIQVEHVKYSDEVPGAYRRLRSEIDALWMMPDSVVVTHDNFRYLAERTKRDRIAFLAFSENFVRAGALLSVAPDYATMGAQAAAILERMLTQADATPVIQTPIGSSLVVNADTARTLGIDIDANILSFADKVIDGND